MLAQVYAVIFHSSNSQTPLFKEIIIGSSLNVKTSNKCKEWSHNDE